MAKSEQEQPRASHVLQVEGWLQPPSDVSDGYCSVRTILEQRKGDLVMRLSSVTARLLYLTSKNDRAQYLETRAECTVLVHEISAAKQRLREHRFEHGC